MTIKIYKTDLRMDTPLQQDSTAVTSQPSSGMQRVIYQILDVVLLCRLNKAHIAIHGRTREEPSKTSRVRTEENRSAINNIVLAQEIITIQCDFMTNQSTATWTVLLQQETEGTTVWIGIHQDATEELLIAGK